MNDISEMLPLLNTMISGLAEHFGSDCEFVVHDYSKGVDRSIVSIVNGEVTDRQVGECATSIGLRISQGQRIEGDEKDGLFNYFSQTRDGRILKSSTLYLKNDAGEIIGSLCVNNDITQLRQAKKALDRMIQIDDEKKSNSPKDMVFVGKVDDLLISLINDSIASVGTPVSMMSRDQKIAGIRFLNDKGVFKIQKSCDVVAQYYDISKFTVYNYLDEIRKMWP